MARCAARCEKRDEREAERVAMVAKGGYVLLLPHFSSIMQTPMLRISTFLITCWSNVCWKAACTTIAEEFRTHTYTVNWLVKFLYFGSNFKQTNKQPQPRARRCVCFAKRNGSLRSRGYVRVRSRARTCARLRARTIRESSSSGAELEAARRGAGENASPLLLAQQYV